MKYIKNMNVNEVSNNYVQGKDHNSEVSDEFKGLTTQQLNLNIKKLQTDLEAEVFSISLRYNTKINKMRAAVEILEKQKPP